jgi:hypothetical protein
MITRPVLTAAASVVGVLVAGTAAVGANIGILTAADSSEVGELSAAVDAPLDTKAPVGVEVVDVYLDDLDALLSPTTVPSHSAAGSTWTPASSGSDGTSGSSDAGQSSTYEAFAVDAAGEIVIENYGDRIEIESVSPASGYAYATSVQSARALTVTFDGPSTLVFRAVLNADGTISASVEAAPAVTTPAPAPTPTAAPAYHDDDDDEYDDEHESDHDDDHDDEHDEHEGADDDD